MSPLLELAGLTKTYSHRSTAAGGKGEVHALRNVTLRLEAGEHLSIVGGSGCGKTTLAKVVMGLIRPDAGTILFDGSSIPGSPAVMRRYRSRVRMVFQDPFASLDPRFTVRAILQEALIVGDVIGRKETQDRMAGALAAVALPADVLHRYPHEFSGGERQRIAIARALMTSPQLLVLDEALSSIDVLAQKRILQLLQALQKEGRLTFIFISHNLRVVRRISRKIAVMSGGRIVEYGTVDDIFQRPAHEYTRRMLRAAFDYRCPASEEVEVENGTWRDVGGGHMVFDQ